MMFGYYGDLSAWGWFGMVLGMVAFWSLVVAAVYWLVRSLSDTNRAHLRVPPEQMLAERFARGEIDETEYRNRLDALHGTVRR